MERAFGIPVPVREERLGVVIGKDGKTKKMIEEAFNVKITVDPKSSTVYIATAENGTPIDVMRAKQVVEAISLGFSSEEALLLVDEDYIFEKIDLSDIAKNPDDLKRIKSRIIGKNGKVKNIIENQTGTKILIGEKVVGMLGEYANVEVARKAITMLIEGRTHASVYSFLREASYELKKQKLKLWKEPWEAGGGRDKV